MPRGPFDPNPQPQQPPGLGGGIGNNPIKTQNPQQPPITPPPSPGLGSPPTGQGAPGGGGGAPGGGGGMSPQHPPRFPGRQRPYPGGVGRRPLANRFGLGRPGPQGPGWTHGQGLPADQLDQLNAYDTLPPGYDSYEDIPGGTGGMTGGGPGRMPPRWPMHAMMPWWRRGRPPYGPQMPDQEPPGPRTQQPPGPPNPYMEPYWGNQWGVQPPWEDGQGQQGMMPWRRRMMMQNPWWRRRMMMQNPWWRRRMMMQGRRPFPQQGPFFPPRRGMTAAMPGTQGPPQGPGPHAPGPPLTPPQEWPPDGTFPFPPNPTS
jgi:hypothetical protein